MKEPSAARTIPGDYYIMIAGTARFLNVHTTNLSARKWLVAGGWACPSACFALTFSQCVRPLLPCGKHQGEERDPHFLRERREAPAGPGCAAPAGVVWGDVCGVVWCGGCFVE